MVLHYAPLLPFRTEEHEGQFRRSLNFAAVWRGGLSHSQRSPHIAESRALVPDLFAGDTNSLERIAIKQ